MHTDTNTHTLSHSHRNRLCHPIRASTVLYCIQDSSVKLLMPDYRCYYYFILENFLFSLLSLSIFLCFTHHIARSGVHCLHKIVRILSSLHLSSESMRILSSMHSMCSTQKLHIFFSLHFCCIQIKFSIAFVCACVTC